MEIWLVMIPSLPICRWKLPLYQSAKALAIQVTLTTMKKRRSGCPSLRSVPRSLQSFRVSLPTPLLCVPKKTKGWIWSALRAQVPCPYVNFGRWESVGVHLDLFGQKREKGSSFWSCGKGSSLSAIHPSTSHYKLQGGSLRQVLNKIPFLLTLTPTHTQTLVGQSLIYWWLFHFLEGDILSFITTYKDLVYGALQDFSGRGQGRAGSKHIHAALWCSDQHWMG